MEVAEERALPPAAGGPLRWPTQIVQGLIRSAALIGLTFLIPLVGVTVGVLGSLVAYSWSANSSAPAPVRYLEGFGETLMVILWVSVALWITHLLTSRALAQIARRRARRWVGLRLDVAYLPVPAVTRMATGYWWDGHEYHRSLREARRRARIKVRVRDPQQRWDGVWALVSGVTVLPVAALPLLALAGGVFLLVPPVDGAQRVFGVPLVLAALAGAPFAWRLLGPIAARFLGPVPHGRLGRRVEELEAARADLTQTQTAELERIERGLHDGAQARLVTLGMSMQAAERMIDTDPEGAKALLAEARASSISALAELRSLVHGINPPVLAERGLVDAVRALALDAPIEVTVRSSLLPGMERPMEAALYFATAEILANVAKHARATSATIDLDYACEKLTVTVVDDGVGGANASAGSGLRGIERRMHVFRGLLEVDSPVGGPTRVIVEVPCASS